MKMGFPNEGFRSVRLKKVICILRRSLCAVTSSSNIQQPLSSLLCVNFVPAELKRLHPDS